MNKNQLMASEYSLADNQANEKHLEEYLPITMRKKDQNFAMLFVKNHFLLQTLSPHASKILIGVLNNILYGNIFIENSSFRQLYKGRNNTRTSEYQMSHQTYNKAFDELVNKKILININEPEKQEAFGIDTSYISYSSRDNLFLINPSIAGKGSLKDIRQIRVSFEQCFLINEDNTSELVQGMKTQISYDGAEQISPITHDLKSNVVENRNGVVVETATVERKSQKQVELELENRSLELKNKQMELQLKLIEAQQKKKEDYLPGFEPE